MIPTFVLLAAVHLAAADPEARIGFPFLVDGRPMDPGVYRIEPVQPGAFWLHSRAGSRSAFLAAPVTSRATAGPGQLQFRCGAEGCVLQRVRLAGSTVVYQKAGVTPPTGSILVVPLSTR